MQASPPDDLLAQVSSLVATAEQLKKQMDSFAQRVADSLSREQTMADELPPSQETCQTFEPRPMDEEPLHEQAEVEYPEPTEDPPSTEQSWESPEGRVLGLDLPSRLPQYIEETLFRQLKAELYSKDNSMKLSEALTFGAGSLLKGFNTVDVEESIKYYRETYDLDLREPSKNVVTIENIELKPADMFRLVPMVFLNDSTINYYIKIIQRYILDQSRASEFHFFNTYFFSKIRHEITNICLQQDLMLTPKNRPLLQTQMDPVNKRIRGWFKRVKLFHRKYILLPVNKKDHWFTVVIVNLPALLAHFAQDQDLSLLRPEERPYILLMDPLVNVEDTMELMLRLFLENELKETIGPTYELKVMNKEELNPSDPEKSLLITDKNLPAVQLIIPRQRNTYDCGVFALEYMESFVLDPSFVLSRLGNSQHVADWFPKSLVDGKRKQMISFIINHSKGLDMETNVKELLKQREALLKEKREDPDEFDQVVPEEVAKYLPTEEALESPSEEDKARLFVRTYYNILPKEITSLCHMYFEHNFSNK